MTAESEPYASRAAALVNVGTPVMPAYSLSNFDSTTFFSAVRTDGRTNGLPLSSRYAPTPCYGQVDVKTLFADEVTEHTQINFFRVAVRFVGLSNTWLMLEKESLATLGDTSALLT